MYVVGFVSLLGSIVLTLSVDFSVLPHYHLYSGIVLARQGVGETMNRMYSVR